MFILTAIYIISTKISLSLSVIFEIYVSICNSKQNLFFPSRFLEPALSLAGGGVFLTDLILLAVSTWGGLGLRLKGDKSKTNHGPDHLWILWR